MARTTYAPRGALKAKPGDPMEGANPKKATCTATNRQGKRCGKPPIPGGTVCRLHGGSAPQVREKAEQRLMGYQHVALDRLKELMEQTTFPSTAFAAVRDVLDRTMGKPKESIDMNVSGEVALVPERLAAARKRLSQNS